MCRPTESIGRLSSSLAIQSAATVCGEDGQTTISGNTTDEEYQRTMGAMFAVYWTMRLSLDGAQSFCFGVDDDWNTLSDKSQKPIRTPEEKTKRAAALEQIDWKLVQQLLLDAGILKVAPGGQHTHDFERTLVMLHF